MDEHDELRHHAADSEAVQAVVDRVLSYHPGAPADTVRAELETGLSRIGASMPEEWLDETARRISRADPAQ